ncbi:MAG: NADH-quinone oxidoreductase subunit J, partial [Desulfobacterales bacterium]
MRLYTILFYLLAVVIVVATVLAITRRNMVHAVIYLVVSFFGSALLFYLFGAPLLAALEVIIYAGAIMVLFLFIIMM